jgi:5-methylcytosine-specific restriction protein A
MPHSAPRPCSNRTCSGLTRNGVCGVCGPIRRGNDRSYDAHRGTAAERGYDHTWRKVRHMYLSSEPLCFDCKGGGRVTIATEVHHIIAKRNGGTNEEDNLMSLC